MRALLLAVLGVVTAFHANAADDPVFRSLGQPALTPEANSRSIVSEFRLGAFGHSFFSDNEQGSVDVNGELLFAKPFTSTDPWIDALLPRPHIGATINTEGLTSMGYAGFTWTLPLGEKLFVEGSLGASINNGITGPAAGVLGNRIPVGCNLLFRESASLGFNLTPQWSVIGTIEHASNAGLCDANSGITNAGVRFGYKF